MGLAFGGAGRGFDPHLLHNPAIRGPIGHNNSIRLGQTAACQPPAPRRRGRLDADTATAVERQPVASLGSTAILVTCCTASFRPPEGLNVGHAEPASPQSAECGEVLARHSRSPASRRPYLPRFMRSRQNSNGDPCVSQAATLRMRSDVSGEGAPIVVVGGGLTGWARQGWFHSRLC